MDFKMKALLPIRHHNRDFFIADFGDDVVPKDDIASMEHPLFTLSTKPDNAIRYYEHNGNSITIAPSAYGMATIHDKDILIYCISQLMKGVNEAIDKAKVNGKEEYEAPSRKVRFKAYDLLVTTNRGTGGREYTLLRKAFDRLAGTLITTDIKTGGKQIIKGFGIIDEYEIIIADPKTKRMVELELTLSKWLYNSILSREVLSINRDYFRLRKPLERRIYEIVRKHCGKNQQWKIGLDNLLKKSGSSSTKRKFKHMLNHMVKHDHLPDYSIAIEENNVVVFYNKNRQLAHKQNSDNLKEPFVKIETIEKAKKIIRPFGLDIYSLKDDWVHWWRESGEPELRSPDGAFINFCKKRVSKK